MMLRRRIAREDEWMLSGGGVKRCLASFEHINLFDYAIALSVFGALLMMVRKFLRISSWNDP